MDSTESLHYMLGKIAENKDGNKHGNKDTVGKKLTTLPSVSIDVFIKTACDIIF